MRNTCLRCFLRGRASCDRCKGPDENGMPVLPKPPAPRRGDGAAMRYVEGDGATLALRLNMRAVSSAAWDNAVRVLENQP